jgi:uncharacterized protein
LKPIIVADAGPLIALAKIDQLALLPALFATVHIPAYVLDEAAGNIAMSGARAVRAFAETRATIHANSNDPLVQRLSIEIDAGEAQAIALAQSLHCGVLIDDLLGRGVAKRLGLSVIGVLGVLLQGKRAGHIAAIRQSLDALTLARYRLSDALVAEVLRQANEEITYEPKQTEAPHNA